MKSKTSEIILKYINDKRQASGSDIANYLGITTRAVRKQLNNLLKEKLIYKVGRPPRVFYLIALSKEEVVYSQVSLSIRKVINENFLNITPRGEREEGWSGFVSWCKERNFSVENTAEEYRQSIKKYNFYKKDGLINGMYKMKKTFSEVGVDKLFYLDFYSIERFGKTKLGQLLLYAKQSQDKNLIKELINKIKPQVESLIKKYKVEAVGFIPPTVKREVQLMRELERELHLKKPKFNLIKIKTPIIIPQKTLKKLEDRIENAKNTIIVDDTYHYDTILLIDDALGSGATINETAKKIKSQKLADTIVGLAITGSFSGFEVISEV